MDYRNDTRWVMRYPGQGESILFGQTSFFQTSGVNRWNSYGEPDSALGFPEDGERVLRAVNSIRG